MNNLTVSASPHITNKKNSTRGIMLDVIIALMPALIAAVFFFGYHVVINVVVCIVFCFGIELLYGLIIKKDFSLNGVKKSSALDLSSVVTGIILALNLPAKMKVSGWDLNVYKASSHSLENMIISFDGILVCIIGSLFAIVLVKMLFGGIGKNFANPAASARVFLLLAFGFGAVQTIGLGFNASTGATWLSGNKATSNSSLLFNLFIGNHGSAAVGETCMIALILGYLYLSIRRVIDFRIPLMIVASAAVFALLFDGLGRNLTGPKLINNLLANIMSGGLVFGAIFMATDYSTSPNTFIGNIIFCIGIGLFTMLIRVYANWPEGMSFAIVLMNLVVPLIDKYIVPKPFGYVKTVKTIKTSVNGTEGVKRV